MSSYRVLEIFVLLGFILFGFAIHVKTRDTMIITIHFNSANSYKGWKNMRTCFSILSDYGKGVYIHDASPNILMSPF